MSNVFHKLVQINVDVKSGRLEDDCGIGTVATSDFPSHKILPITSPATLALPVRRSRLKWRLLICTIKRHSYNSEGRYIASKFVSATLDSPGLKLQGCFIFGFAKCRSFCSNSIAQSHLDFKRRFSDYPGQRSLNFDTSSRLLGSINVRILSMDSFLAKPPLPVRESFFFNRGRLDGMQVSVISRPASHPFTSPRDHTSIQPSAAFPQRRLNNEDLAQRQRSTRWMWTKPATGVSTSLTNPWTLAPAD